MFVGQWETFTNYKKGHIVNNDSGYYYICLVDHVSCNLVYPHNNNDDDIYWMYISSSFLNSFTRIKPEPKPKNEPVSTKKILKITTANLLNMLNDPIDKNINNENEKLKNENYLTKLKKGNELLKNGDMDGYMKLSNNDYSNDYSLDDESSEPKSSLKRKLKTIENDISEYKKRKTGHDPEISLYEKLMLMNVDIDTKTFIIKWN